MIIAKNTRKLLLREVPFTRTFFVSYSRYGLRKNIEMACSIFFRYTCVRTHVCETENDIGYFVSHIGLIICCATSYRS